MKATRHHGGRLHMHPRGQKSSMQMKPTRLKSGRRHGRK